MDNYEWDPEKAVSNFHKHGVSFADATAVLENEQALTIADDHPDEQRFVTIGPDLTGRILVIVYTYRSEKIRIISARKATAGERRTYQEG